MTVDQRDSRDNMSRAKRPSPFGTSLFIGLRSLDVFIQYGILAKGLADPLLSRISSAPTPTSAAVVAFGLPLQPLIVLGMAAGTAIKQIFWVTYIANEEMPARNALMISIANTVFNSANSILALTTVASSFAPSYFTNTDNPTTLSPIALTGAFAYILGSAIELISEIQRKNFKDDARNAGKPYTGGLFSLARHINYSGYTIMRSAYAFTAGGFIPGLVVAAFFGGDFAFRGVPVLDDYCTKRYGASWTEFKKRVSYKLLPGIY